MGTRVFTEQDFPEEDFPTPMKDDFEGELKRLTERKERLEYELKQVQDDINNLVMLERFVNS